MWWPSYVSRLAQYAVVLRLLRKDTYQPMEIFWDVDNQPNGDAASVASHVKKMVENVPNIDGKLVALGTDGCSVIMGPETGVQKRLMVQSWPYAFSVWCDAHQ
eukprot:Hpha_TRINITY_DN16858_c0_g1::TRINITY_DN16858_c0_g1_i1::g.148410::m.148410